MTRRQLVSMVRTLSRCYGSNKRAEKPVRLVFSGVRPGSPTSELLQNLTGFENWGSEVVRIEEEPYFRLFPQSQLVYISPDGADLADEFDGEDAVFIIGGIVDGNRLTGKSRLKADLQGIPSVRLPIQEQVELKGLSAILAANQVLDIVLARRQGQNWVEALRGQIPDRKQRRQL